MGRSKNDYITMLNIKPSDVIESLRKKIKQLELEIQVLKNKLKENEK